MNVFKPVFFTNKQNMQKQNKIQATHEQNTHTHTQIKLKRRFSSTKKPSTKSKTNETTINTNKKKKQNIERMFLFCLYFTYLVHYNLQLLIIFLLHDIVNFVVFLNP